MTRRKLIEGEVVHVSGRSCEVVCAKPLRVRLILAGGEPDPEAAPFVVKRADVDETDEAPFLVTRLMSYQPGQAFSGVCRCGRTATLILPAVKGSHRALLGCNRCDLPGRDGVLHQQASAAELEQDRTK